MSAGTFSSWPNGKKIAVSVTVMFEAWAEGKSPNYTVQNSSPKPGVPDTAMQAWATYGGRVGVWRLLQMLDRMQIPATFFTSARCVELYPDAVKHIVSSGYDLAAHCYSQDQILTHLTLDEQRATIRKSVDMLQECTGYEVTGWASPAVAFTPETSGFLAEAGLKWHTDVTYADLPFRIHTPHGDIAGVPTSDFSELRVMRANPGDFLDVYKRTLAFLQEDPSMSMIVLVFHAQFGGRPFILSVIQETLRYLAKSPDVWFTNHKELAKWALEPGRDLPPYQERFFSGLASGVTAK